MGSQFSDISNALFTRTQARVLGILFRYPERSHYLGEILARANGGSGAVRRELDRLVKAGLVERHKVGNQQHYQANHRSPVFDELGRLVAKVTESANPLELRSASIAALCRRYSVVRLSLFGSAARGELTPASDLDFVIEFAPEKSPTLAGLTGFKDELEALVGRRVDIATPAILNNPHRRKAIEKDMEVIYERKGSRLPVGHARRRN